MLIVECGGLIAPSGNTLHGGARRLPRARSSGRHGRGRRGRDPGRAQAGGWSSPMSCSRRSTTCSINAPCRHPARHVRAGDLFRRPPARRSTGRVRPGGSGGGYLTVGAEAVELGLDVFGTAFVLLSALEEAIIPRRDGHGRVPASATLAVRAGFAQRPLVDEYTEVLWWTFARLWPNLERAPRSFVVRPTHDVDWPYYSRGRTIETLRLTLPTWHCGETARWGSPACGRSPLSAGVAAMQIRATPSSS